MRTSAFGLALVLALPLVPACGGGGQYGYAHEYEPLGDERSYLERTTELSFEEVRRTRPEEQQFISWFGVVVEEPTAEGDQTRLVLSLRAHQDRHLCSSSSSDSCRVTVSEREIGRFVALIHIRPEDAAEGRLRLNVGSLVRVYGRSQGNDPSDAPIIAAEYYRHWPTHYYVTTAAAGSMRR
jgi:hypothetical protein